MQINNDAGNPTLAPRFTTPIQVQYFAEQPDAFGPQCLIKLTATPVVQNKLAGLFKRLKPITRGIDG